MCYTKIPKNTGILFSKIPVSVFESNPGIPVFSGIPQGPGPQTVLILAPGVQREGEVRANGKIEADGLALAGQCEAKGQALGRLGWCCFHLQQPFLVLPISEI